MNIYTAHYRYKGSDRIDITAKTNSWPGSVFAPTWEMVNGFRAQKITEWEYTLQYMGLMTSRWYHYPGEVRSAIRAMTDGDSLTLVCFCPPQTFCHRILAARMLEGLAWGQYRGERIL